MEIILEDLKDYESKVTIAVECLSNKNINKKIEMITNPCENSIRYAVINKHVVIATEKDLQKALDIFNKL